MALELFFPDDNTNNNKHNFLLYDQPIAVFLILHPCNKTAYHHFTQEEIEAGMNKMLTITGQ